MKHDAQQLAKRFTFKNIKNGDVVVTAEFHRVVDRNWGRKAGRRFIHNIAVVSIEPGQKEGCGTRIMNTAVGQQGVMKLLPARKGAREAKLEAAVREIVRTYEVPNLSVAMFERAMNRAKRLIQS